MRFFRGAIVEQTDFISTPGQATDCCIGSTQTRTVLPRRKQETHYVFIHTAQLLAATDMKNSTKRLMIPSAACTYASAFAYGCETLEDQSQPFRFPQELSNVVPMSLDIVTGGGYLRKQSNYLSNTILSISLCKRIFDLNKTDKCMAGGNGWLHKMTYRQNAARLPSASAFSSPWKSPE